MQIQVDGSSKDERKNCRIQCNPNSAKRKHKKIGKYEKGFFLIKNYCLSDSLFLKIIYFSFKISKCFRF